MDEFEKLLKSERASVERFVRFRIGSKHDAEDVLQEVYLTAYQKFCQLKSKESFKAWVIGIARNKCNDYYRKKTTKSEIPIVEIRESKLSDSRYIVGRYTVRIGDKCYDTVCVIDIERPDCGVVLEHFLDKNGKTILSRRYNRNDWEIDRYQKTWCEQLPENDKLIINGTTYVHWDDCITEYII